MRDASSSGKFPRVTMLEAARRQLVVAVELYFENRDALAIHTLAAAAHQILDDLARKEGQESFLENLTKQMAAVLPEEERPQAANTIRNAIRDPQNFLKHADHASGPDEEFEYSPGLTEVILIGALALLQRRGDVPPELLAFQGWILMHHPAFRPLATSVDADAIEAAKRRFGGYSRADYFREAMREMTGK